MVGQTVDVMVEGESKLVSRQAARSHTGVELGAGFARHAHVGEPADPPKTQLVGRTRGDQIVVFDGTLSQKGDLLDVTIDRAGGMTLFGRQRVAAAV